MTLVVILETAPSSILRESNDIEGIKCILAPFIVIDGGDGGLALGDVAVAVGISRIGGHNLVLGGNLPPGLLRAGRSNGVGDDPLGVPSPANTRFTGDQYGLILDVPDHATRIHCGRSPVTPITSAGKIATGALRRSRKKAEVKVLPKS